VLRVDGPLLVRETGGNAKTITLDGASLATLAAFAGVDLQEPFDVGQDTPPLGDADAPLAIDADDTRVLAEWWHLGWEAIDTVSAADNADATTIQLWPEHFDAGCSIAYGPGPDDRCNLGASPGDGTSDEPYLYVGPWSDARPGDARYWNAPFGAVARRPDITTRKEAVDFLTRGVQLLSTRTARR
jgi:hypothetical protein